MRARAPFCLALSAIALGGSASLAQDAWTPRGPRDPDRERYEPRPPGFVDHREPVEIAPTGKLSVVTTDRTNIVVIMVDDHPEMDERIWRRLPAIRSLFLDQGIHFTHYHGNDPFCCPGRAGFLTGLTTDHHRVWTNDARLLDPRTTLATELRARGYFTILAGKYLNGHHRSIDPTPPGWSRSAWTSNAYYNYREHVNGRTVYHDDDPEDYQPDVAFNRALQFLRQAPAHRPLFAWVTPYVTHSGKDPFRADGGRRYAPIAPRFRTDKRCSGLAPWITPAHRDSNRDRPRHQRHWGSFRRGYNLVRTCRALLAVDAGVARIVRELKAQGRFRNTLFVLTADNGMGWGAHGRYGKQVSFSTQVPLYVHWAAGRGTQPSDDGTYLSNVDLADTLCEVGGCALGPYRIGRRTSDGTSFLPVILGTGTVWREALYTENLGRPLWRAIRTTPESPLGLWHYVEYSTGERELYDASGGHCWDWQPDDPGDPCELTNLAGRPRYADVRARLHDLLAAAIRTGGAGPRFSGR